MNMHVSNRGWLRLLLTLTLLLSSITATSLHAVAQQSGLVDESTYIVESNGNQIEWSGSWLYDEALSSVDADLELVALATPASSILIGYLPGGLGLDEARDITLEEIAGVATEYIELDRGSYDNVSYSLDIASLDVVDLAIFSLFISEGDEIVAYLYLSPVFLFESGMGDAQASITINGAPIYEGVDPAGLQEVIDTEGDVTGEGALEDVVASQPDVGNDGVDPTATPDDPGVDGAEPSPEPTPDLTLPDEEDPTATPDLALPDGDDPADAPDLTLADDPEGTPDRMLPDDDGDVAPTPESATDEIDPSYADLGVVEQGLYQSPQFSTEITWDANYALDVEHEAPVSSISGTDATDQLNLIWEDPASLVLFEIEIFEDTWTATEYVDSWTSDEFLGPAAEILLVEESGDRGGVVILDELDTGEPFLAYYELIVLNDSQVALLSLVGDTASFAQAADQATGGITVDGEPVFTEFDGEEIQEWLDF